MSDEKLFPNLIRTFEPLSLRQSVSPLDRRRL